MFSGARSLAAEIFPVYALAETTVTAGSGADGTAINGLAVDTGALPTRFNNVTILVPIEAALSEGENGTLSAKIQTSPDGVDWSDIAGAAAEMALTGDAGGTSERGVLKLGADMAFADAQVRVVVTPTLSAAATDTAAVSAVALFGAPEESPV